MSDIPINTQDAHLPTPTGPLCNSESAIVNSESTWKNVYVAQSG